MNQGEVAESFEKTANATKKLVPWIIGFTLLTFITGGLFYIYQNSGFKEYNASLKYLASLEGDEKDKEIKRFFSLENSSDFHSGILAAVTKNGIWIWEKDGLRFYKESDRPFYIYVTRGCKEANGLTEKFERENIPISQTTFDLIDSVVFYRPYKIENKSFFIKENNVHPGNYVQIKVNTDTKEVKSISVAGEFDPPTNWSYCNVHFGS